MIDCLKFVSALALCKRFLFLKIYILLENFTNK
nr:MAG TPA: hypothetical protein [Caudoviricetes sp.]